MKVPIAVLAFLLLLGAGLLACSDSPTVPADAPEGHTVMKGGAAHAPGLSNPSANCASCHGTDLRGGSSGQTSCYSCHGQKW